MSETKNNVICFPVVHLWRSPWWYRIDRDWGYASSNHVSNSCWRASIKWSYDSISKAGMHLGHHLPAIDKSDYIAAPANDPSMRVDGILPLVVLHYGMYSHELIARKLESQIIFADKSVLRAGLPKVHDLPNAASWHNLNGYKIVYEKDIKFEKVHQLWHDFPVPIVPPPVVDHQSIYKTLLKYNKSAAEDYRKCYQF
jgi:hypothetical protein